GTYDPLDFFGNADFSVSSGCLATDGFHVNDGVTCAVNWLDAIVTLTDLPSLSTRTYDYSAFLPSTGAVTGVDILFGDLSGVVSIPIGPVVLAADPDPAFNGSFALEFSHSIVNLDRNGVLAATADARFCRVAEAGMPCAVPEPGTVGLIVAALGAGWLA